MLAARALFARLGERRRPLQPFTVDNHKTLRATAAEAKKSCCPKQLSQPKHRRRAPTRSSHHNSMALAAAEARATAAEEELEVLRDALAASAPSNASNDNELIKALERERDAALDARDAAEEARAKAERQLSQSIDSVKDGAKGALSQLQKLSLIHI